MNQKHLTIINHKKKQLNPQLFTNQNSPITALTVHSLTCKQLNAANFNQPQLETIVLKLPQLEYISTQAFTGSENCRTLSIQLKQIQNENFLHKLSQLEHLEIDSHQTLQLDRQLFRANSKLKSVTINCRLLFVHSQLFREQKQLEYLALINYGPRSVSGTMFMTLNSFGYFDWLRTLRIRNSEIMFSDLNRILTKLVLINCNISNYRLNFLQQLRLLKYLNIRNCTQILVRNQFRFNPYLKVLILRANYAPFTNLLPDLIRLQFLDLSRCVLTTIVTDPNDSYRNIAYLNLEMNCLRELFSHNFDCCPHLIVLNLRHNRVERLSESVFSSLQNLEVLLLESNKLTTIERNCFASLRKLRFLNLSDNYLEEVKSDWWNLKLNYALETYNLSSNLLATIAKNAFEPFRKLIHLNLSINNITSLGKYHFKNLQQLNRLNLSVNNIQQINRKSFRRLDSLKTLNLHKNHLKSLRRTMFTTMRQLKSLDLSCNRLKNIGMVFDRNIKLQNVYLYGNKLRKIAMKSNFLAPHLVMFVDSDSFAIISKKDFYSLKIANVFTNSVGVHELHFKTILE